MKRIQYIFLLWIGLSLQPTLWAQGLNTDSLFSIWSDSSLSEETRINAYWEFLRPGVRGGEAEAEMHKWFKGSEEALEIAERLDKRAYLGRLQANVGEYEQ